MFSRLEGDTAILVHRGVYRSADLFSWDGKLFAQVAGGYVRLRADGSTTKDGVRLEHMEFEGPLYADRFGRLTVQGGEGRKPVALTAEGVLQIEHKNA